MPTLGATASGGCKSQVSLYFAGACMLETAGYSVSGRSENKFVKRSPSMKKVAVRSPRPASSSQTPITLPSPKLFGSLMISSSSPAKTAPLDETPQDSGVRPTGEYTEAHSEETKPT